MSPTARTAAVVAALAFSALVLPWTVLALVVVALVGGLAADVFAVRRSPAVRRSLPGSAARGVPAMVSLTQVVPVSGSVRLRQPVPPDVELEPSEAETRLEGVLVARRRGRHVLRAPVARRTGPLGLGRRDFTVLDEAELHVYPDLPAASRIADSVRRGRFRETGHRTRGSLGLGTEFESIREYQPDDDIRQVNWAASERVGRPMSNQYRVEQDRDIVCALDSGRLMGAPLAGGTRLDVAVDAVAAIAAVADELGDRCGLIAFDAEIRRHVRPSRRAARDVVAALFDLEPTRVDSDFALAFHRIGSSKRAFVLVLTDLLEPSAARPLIDAVPILARRHHVVVAGATDPDLQRLVSADSASALAVYRAVAATEVLVAREQAVSALRSAGATVVEAPPERLGAACVQAYLRAKARARL
ncbi:MAG: DUF58 domain-containing protein [Actinomycetota bacterium]|nr:DUF58 domain-containing protein [Actinomycetota bacterium]